MGTTATPLTNLPSGSDMLRIMDAMGRGSLVAFLRRALRLSCANATFSRVDGPCSRR